MTRLLFLIPLALAACDPLSGELDDSRDTLDAQLAADSSYTYSRVFQSFFGFGDETRIEVVDGEVVGRSYQSYDADGGVIVEWMEQGEELGSHEDEGEPLRTLPQLYDECDDTVLSVDRDDNDVLLTFDTANLLELCVYIPKGCQDDCAVGIQIGSIDFAQP